MPSSPWPGREIEDEGARANCFEAWREISLNPQEPEFIIPCYNNESREEAFWRTLCVDRSRSGIGRADPSQGTTNRYFYSKLKAARDGYYDDMIGSPILTGQIAGGLCMTREAATNPDFANFTYDTANTISYCFAKTDNRYNWFCLLPADSEPGDWIAVFKGIDVPFVVRRQPEDNTAAREAGRLVRKTFVGPCYVHGLMDGGFTERAEKANQCSRLDFQ
ncbi:hypothetical protein G7Y89_g10200 [Cudoniella acicularis]|uniref:Uncharacterized protein n=1 Tax=Cudoniella acicularis TaxID=354080 RepID=A0A8H4RFZ1_9HELO|nr:hypothetical protein G7Y89_g10200 [Cudoniella acicularis]